MKGIPSNSIVDSGTNSLNLGRNLLNAILPGFSPQQRALLLACIQDGHLVAVSDVDAAGPWPDLTFILQGESTDVQLRITSRDYWQYNVQKEGAALAAITLGDDGLAILGLPLMNPYFTIFDGDADNGRGVIRFATRT
jgi:hypothetical protein